MFVTLFYANKQDNSLSYSKMKPVNMTALKQPTARPAQCFPLCVTPLSPQHVNGRPNIVISTFIFTALQQTWRERGGAGEK